MNDFMSHLELLVPLERSSKHVWHNCTKNKSLLTAKTLRGMPGGVSGTTDAAICWKIAVDTVCPSLGLHVVVEVKVEGEVDQYALRQAIIEVVLANEHALSVRSIGMLTDLRELWFILWTEKEFVRFSKVKRDVADLILRRVVKEEEVQSTGNVRWTAEGGEGGPLRPLWARELSVENDRPTDMGGGDGLTTRLIELKVRGSGYYRTTRVFCRDRTHASG